MGSRVTISLSEPVKENPSEPIAADGTVVVNYHDYLNFDQSTQQLENTDKNYADGEQYQPDIYDGNNVIGGDKEGDRGIVMVFTPTINWKYHDKAKQANREIKDVEALPEGFPEGLE